MRKGDRLTLCVKSFPNDRFHFSITPLMNCHCRNVLSFIGVVGIDVSSSVTWNSKFNVICSVILYDWSLRSSYRFTSVAPTKRDQPTRVVSCRQWQKLPLQFFQQKKDPWGLWKKSALMDLLLFAWHRNEGKSSFRIFCSIFHEMRSKMTKNDKNAKRKTHTKISPYWVINKIAFWFFCETKKSS